MSFNSIAFFIFLPTVVLVNFSLPQRARWIFLLLASYFFYMYWEPAYLLLIVISTLIDYSAGIMLGKAESKNTRRSLLILSIAVNLGLLFAFKYYDFFQEAVAQLLALFDYSYSPSRSSLLLPIGISFFTFQTMGYSIDVYRGTIKPEKHLGYYALYVAFFPQLVAGPIERAANLIHQFKKEHVVDYARITEGMKLVLWGLIKKVVIADRLALFVDHVYGDPGKFSGPPLLLATVFFAFQIYCDFSGYSDIAIGSARILGIRLMLNFRRPYHARSIRDFWQRWHISLSTWFKDYLYIPLGGSRTQIWRWQLNLFITFLISGLWHGARWNFLAWGALHGIFIVISNLTSAVRMRFSRAAGLERYPSVLRLMNIAITFAAVNFAWIFFRANNINDAVHVATNLFQFTAAGSRIMSDGLILGQSAAEFKIALLAIFFLETIHFFQARMSLKEIFARQPIYVRWSGYALAAIILLNWGIVKETPFIYFQF
ncbi:MAG: MBOAT family O-acyltransferase [Elusimicrobiota bacterium]